MSSSYGKYIKYKTQDNYIITYAHLNKSLVKEGQKIKQGQKMALVGSTGQSTGYHLHYSIEKNNTYIDPIPMLSLPTAQKQI